MSICVLMCIQGPRGLFVGLGAQFARDIPFYAFFFGTYELSLSLLREHTEVPQEASYLIAGMYSDWAETLPESAERMR